MISTIPPAITPPSNDGALEFESRAAAATQSQLWRFHDEYVLGTRLEVLVNTQSAILAKEAAAAARKEIIRLDAVFNVRRVDSEIIRLNKIRSANASPELFAVVQLSEQWRRITRGAFDGRMGELLQRWADAPTSTVTSNVTPPQRSIDHSLAALRGSTVTLDPEDRRIALSTSVQLSLDAIAKGYIVDAAVVAARRAAPGIEGLALGIGGDIRCWGIPPNSAGWRVGIPDARSPADNAPLVDRVSLRNAAIATSGRGPRDCIDGRYRSTTISPLTGWPVRDVISASVVASHAADADAIATASLVLSPAESIAMADQLGVAARITNARGEVHQNSAWQSLRLAQAPTVAKAPSLPPELRWPADWEIGITYIAPESNENARSDDFRSPYMVLWVTDEKNRAVNTPAMVGTDPKWQHDNYIWWGMNGAHAEPLIHLRSQATMLSGHYRIFWGGVDDDGKPLPIGKYTLHLEASQERGKHEYRSIVLEIGQKRFKKILPNDPASGGLIITYGHYNDRFNEE